MSFPSDIFLRVRGLAPVENPRSRACSSHRSIKGYGFQRVEAVRMRRYVFANGLGDVDPTRRACANACGVGQFRDQFRLDPI